MRPFQCVADMDDGSFAVLSVDPTKRVDGGCKAIVLSVHETREQAEAAITEEPHP